MTNQSYAFLGLGAMGAGMAGNLAEAGFKLAVHNRTRAKAEPVLRAGARWAPSIADAVSGADVVLLSLADETAVESVLFGAAAGHLRPGTYLVDTSTVSPAYSRTATTRLAEIGVHRVEACVVGNPGQARQGALRVFAAGDEKHIDAVREVLDVLGHQVLEVGDTGAGSTMKLVFNLLLGAQLASLAEGVAYGVAAGLDRTLLLETIRQSGFSSMVMAFRAEIMRDRRYEPAAFRTTLMAKDLRLALQDAAAAGTPLPVTAAAAGEFDRVVSTGQGDADAAVLVEHATRAGT